MEDLEYKLDEPNEDEIKVPDKKYPKKSKLTIILIVIIIILVLVIITGLVLYFTVLKKKEEDKTDKKEEEKTDEKEEDKTDEKEEDKKEENFYIFTDIKTSENNTIKNSFGTNGINYKEGLGNINEGKDYEATDRDNFDLCIPYHVMENKTNYTTILLVIHGGAWRAGNKGDAKGYCKDETYKNFIVATMSHTLLIEQYKEYNLFRIIDEIHAALTTLKKLLITIGFEENK